MNVAYYGLNIPKLSKVNILQMNHERFRVLVLLTIRPEVPSA